MHDLEVGALGSVIRDFLQSHNVQVVGNDIKQAFSHKQSHMGSLSLGNRLYKIKSYSELVNMI